MDAKQIVIDLILKDGVEFFKTKEFVEDYTDKIDWYFWLRDNSWFKPDTVIDALETNKHFKLIERVARNYGQSFYEENK